MTNTVFLDARRAGWNPSSGTGVYARRLLDELARLPQSELRFLALEHSQLLPGTIEAPRSALSRWPRKLASDLGEVPWMARRADLTHLLLPEGFSPRRGHVVTIQDLDVVLRGGAHARSTSYYGWRTARLARSARAVVCPSAQTAQLVADVLGRTTDVHVVHLGVDLPDLGTPPPSPPDSAPYFIYSGGFAARKNVDVLLEAWEQLQRCRPARLVITGDPRSWPVLPRNVELTGSVGRSTYWDLCRHAAGILYPSAREGFGFPILEGALLGKPVICGPVGIVPELPEGLVLVVDIHNPRAIAGGLEAALDGWRPNESAVQIARSHFSWQRCAAEMAAIYARYL